MIEAAFRRKAHSSVRHGRVDSDTAMTGVFGAEVEARTINRRPPSRPPREQRPVNAVLRRYVNGVVVVAGLIVFLPTITVGELLHHGAGRRAARFAIRLISSLCGIRYELRGVDRLEIDRSYVLVPNHSSPLDIPALLLARSDARFLAAAELFSIPLLGAAMRRLGAVPIDRANPLEARRRLSRVAEDGEPGSFVVFAEGGIGAAREQRPFKAGAFVLAILAGAPVVPVSIRGSDSILPRGRRVTVSPGVVVVELHAPIETSTMTLADRKVLRDLTEQTVRAGLAAAR